MAKEYMETLSEVMAELRTRGYTKDFRFNNGVLIDENNKEYSQKDLSVDDTYRFEGTTNPEDESILYAISTSDNDKGCVVNAYGSEASIELDEFIDGI